MPRAAPTSPTGHKTLQPLQIEAALRQQGFGLLAADLAILQRLANGALHSVQRPQRLLARLLEVLRQHRQRVWQDAIGEAIVFFLIEQPVVGGEPLLQRLQIRLQGGQRILQLELGIEQALLVEGPGQLAGTLRQLLQPAARTLTLAEAAP